MTAPTRRRPVRLRGGVDERTRPGYDGPMPRKIRQLIAELQAAGFREFAGGRGSHRKFVHSARPGTVVLSGQAGDDAKPYQEKQIRAAVAEVAS